jgi:ATP-dependent Zn protease
LKKRRPSPRESTAFHEAGHALVGHLLGWDIDAITIGATKSFRGYTLRRRRQAIPGIVDYDRKKGERPDDGPLADRLTLLYAGIVAQRLLCTQRGISSKPVRLGRDIREARDSVRNLSKEEQIELLDSAEKYAVKLLSDPQNWQMLERIAAELLAFETLDGPSLLKLLPGAQDASSYDPLRLYVYGLS